MLKGYVINLNHRPERLAQFYKQQGTLLFKRMPAVDKQILSLLPAEYYFNTEFFLNYIGRPVTFGEIGCTLSHIQCWHEIAADNSLKEDDFALIAEDDVSFKPNFLQLLDGLIGYINASQPDVSLLILQKLSYQNTIWNPDIFNVNDGFKLIEPKSGADCDNAGSAFYAIRKKQAKALVELVKSRKPYWLADQFSKFVELNQIRMLCPMLGFVPLDAASDLEQDREIARAIGNS